MDLFSNDYKITKPLRLIELFAGYGSQAMAFNKLGVPFEHHFVCEFDKYAIKSYNAVHGTNFEPLDIRNITGKDLNITDVDKFTYLLTYSFPCTDLSLAGKQKGMKKGEGTRSGLLWEVERLLKECEELSEQDKRYGMPDILFMENVPQVLSEKNFDDFKLWLDFLHEKGYSSRYDVLNAKNYGIPQNRERCFMFSFKGDWDYVFPAPKRQDKILRDYLEDKVDAKYYINSKRSEKLLSSIVYMSGDKVPCKLLKTDKDKGSFLSLADATMTTTDVASTITARYYKGIAGAGDNMVADKILIKQATKDGYIEMEEGGVFDASFPNSKTRRGRVQDGGTISPTITAQNNEIYRIERKKRLNIPCCINKNGKDGNYCRVSEATLYDVNTNVCRTITCKEPGISVHHSNMCIVIEGGEMNNVIKLGGISNEGLQGGSVYSDEGIAQTLMAGTHGYAMGNVYTDYRIRRYTPKECFRLMGVTDDDAEKMLKVISDTQCYKQAGNSIVVDVMVEMFRNLF